MFKMTDFRFLLFLARTWLCAYSTALEPATTSDVDITQQGYRTKSSATELGLLRIFGQDLGSYALRD